MHHPRTKELLGFDATNIDEAKAKRKDLHAKIAKEPPIAAIVVNFTVGDFVKILHEFNGVTYRDADQWRAVDDLELAIGDVVVVEGKAAHDGEYIEGWYSGYKVRWSRFLASQRRRSQRRPATYTFRSHGVAGLPRFRPVQVQARDEVKNFPATPRFARLCTEAEKIDALAVLRRNAQIAEEGQQVERSEPGDTGSGRSRRPRKQPAGGGGCCASRPKD